MTTWRTLYALLLTTWGTFGLLFLHEYPSDHPTIQVGTRLKRHADPILPVTFTALYWKITSLHHDNRNCLSYPTAIQYGHYTSRRQADEPSTRSHADIFCCIPMIVLSCYAVVVRSLFHCTSSSHLSILFRLNPLTSRPQEAIMLTCSTTHLWLSCPVLPFLLEVCFTALR